MSFQHAPTLEPLDPNPGVGIAIGCLQGRVERRHPRRLPLDSIARLCALVPPPRFHMLRYHGVYAAHSSARPEVVLGPSPSLLRSSRSSPPPTSARPSRAPSIPPSLGLAPAPRLRCRCHHLPRPGLRRTHAPRRGQTPRRHRPRPRQRSASSRPRPSLRRDAPLRPARPLAPFSAPRALVPPAASAPRARKDRQSILRTFCHTHR